MSEKPKAAGFGSRLLSQSAVYGLGNIISKAVSVLLVPIYTRVLTTGDYGVMSVAGVVFSFLSIFLNLGTSSALFRFYHAAGDDEERKSYVTSAFLLLLSTGTVLASIVFVAAGPIASILFGNAADAVYVQTVALWTFMSLFSIVPLAVFRAEGKAKQYISLTLATFLANVVLTIVMVVVLRRGALGSLQANVMATGIVAAALVPFLVRRMKLPPLVSHMREILAFGLPFVPFGLGMLVLNLGDRVFLNTYSGRSEVGLYSLGYTAGMLVNLVLVQPFHTAWWPLVFATEKEDGAKERFGRVLTYFLFVGLGLALALGVLAKDAIHIIAAPAFWPAYNVTFLVALGYVMYGAFYCVTVGTLLTGKSRAFTPLALVGAAVALVAYRVLIPPFGRIGAAAATLLAFTAMAVAGYVTAQRKYPIPYEWGRVARLAAVTAAVFVGASMVSVGNVWADLSVKAGVVAVGYLGGLWLLRFFHKSELRMALDTLGRAYLRIRLPKREADEIEEAEEAMETSERS